MASANIIIETRFGKVIDAMADQVSSWDNSRKRAFECKWKALEHAGAEMCEVRLIGGRVVAHPSEDFTRFLADNGIHV
jgi:hypothetical protein